MTALLFIAAYILPMPIMAACFYYQAFSTMDDFMLRLVAIGITSLAPSAILMVFVLKNILHLVFSVLCVAGLLFSLQHFGFISLTTH